MTHSYPVPSCSVDVEETYRRSRFVTCLGHAPSDDRAKSFLEATRARHPNATHHCWAYNAGPPGSTARVGMSDDGEPKGTAGRPMLKALLHASLGEVVAVCARYFGGTKLGTGGLVRAYTSGTVLALERVPTRLKVHRIPMRVELGYGSVEPTERVLDRLDAVIRERSFEAAVTLRILVPVEQEDELRRALADASRGTAVLVRE